MSVYHGKKLKIIVTGKSHGEKISASIKGLKGFTFDEKIEECADAILAGNYSVGMPDVKSEYEPIIRVMKRLSDALAFVEKTQTDFINDFAHELKTPIVSIKGFAKIVAGGEISEEEKKEYLSLIVYGRQ